LCQECGYRPSFGNSEEKRGIETDLPVAVLAKAKDLNPEAELASVSGDGSQQLNFKDPRIAQYAWKCKLRGLQDNTIERRCYALRKLVDDGGDLNDPTTIETVLAVKNYPTPTKCLAVNIYRSYCKAYRIDWEPVRVKYQPKKPYLPTQQEFMIFIAAMTKKLMIFCRVLFETGCRCGEAVHIEWTDINLENSTIAISHPEKGSSERTLKVTKELCQLIDSLPRKYGLHVFNPKIRTWESNFERERKKITVKMNKPEWMKLHFHTFRHMRGTFDALDGLQAWEIKDKLGHKCISNTEKYVHWAKELRPEGTERYYTQSVATDEEADRQMALGWQFVFFNPETKRIHLRKTK